MSPFGTKRNCPGRTRHFRSWGQTGRTISLATTAALDPSRKWLFSPSSPSGQSITALRNVSRSDSFAPDRNLNAVEIRWPFRLGLQGRIVDRSQDLGWQRAFGHGRKIVPEVLQRRGADDDAIIAFGVEL